MELPLAFLRVVDLTEGDAQYCGRYLADLGAQVVLVEPPGGSAGRRDLAVFGLRNANKASVLLDLASETGQAELLRLAGTAEHRPRVDWPRAGRAAPAGASRAGRRLPHRLRPDGPVPGLRRDRAGAGGAGRGAVPFGPAGRPAGAAAARPHRPDGGRARRTPPISTRCSGARTGRSGSACCPGGNGGPCSAGSASRPSSPTRGTTRSRPRCSAPGTSTRRARWPAPSSPTACGPGSRPAPSASTASGPG